MERVREEMTYSGRDERVSSTGRSAGRWDSCRRSLRRDFEDRSNRTRRTKRRKVMRRLLLPSCCGDAADSVGVCCSICCHGVCWRMRKMRMPSPKRWKVGRHRLERTADLPPPSNELGSNLVENPDTCPARRRTCNCFAPKTSLFPNRKKKTILKSFTYHRRA